MSEQSAFYGVRQIVSGGQTGVDRGALDAAIEMGIEHGGWCPRGRLAEDGPIPDRYQLREALSSEYSYRTERNVIDSDGTLILFRDKLSGGTLLTRRLARKHHKPCLAINLSVEVDIERIRTWIAATSVKRLNCAGPRESGALGIAAQAQQLLIQLLSDEMPSRAKTPNPKSRRDRQRD